MRFRLAASLIASMLHMAAWADNPCESQNNTMEVNACAKLKFEEQDKRLNAAYQALLKTLPSTSDPGVAGDSPRVLMVKAQRRWIDFREADCKAKFQVFAGGSIRNVVYLSCMQERAEQRIKELAPSEWQGG